jgi:hypothetical protein
MTVVRKSSSPVWRYAASILAAVLFVACPPQHCQRTPSTTAPPCSDPVTCTAEQLRVCINQCKPLASEGAECEPDLCAPGGSVCERNLTCVRGADGRATCQRVSQECDPAQPPGSATNRCADGTYCRRLGTSEQAQRGEACEAPPAFIRDGQVTVPSLCSSFVAEGRVCDGDWEDVRRSTSGTPAVCAPCEPGTRCVQLPGESVRLCRRPCDPANPGASCPCGAVQCVPGSTAGSNFCERCAETGASCRATNPDRTLRCCDSEAACTNGTCCRPRGRACTSNTQCCGTDRCTGGACSACTPTGGTASSADACCPGLSLSGGRCVAPCSTPAGQSCSISGARGVCAQGRSEGCNERGEVICRATTSPSSETCDNRDNDCDGSTDEDLRQACRVQPAGCTQEVAGTQQCSGGRWGTCTPTETLCAICGSPGCGACYGQSCDPNDARSCGPNLYCQVLGGRPFCERTPISVRTSCPPTGCYKPSDLSYDRTTCFNPRP